MMYLTVSTNSTDGWNSYSYSGLVKSPTCGGRSNTNLCLPRENLINTVIHGGLRKRGKVIEKPVSYTADFVYKENGETVVEDAKGVRTDKYIIKRKLMLWVHGIRVREV